MSGAFLVPLGLLLITYGLFSLFRPDAIAGYELRRLKRHPNANWPFEREWYANYLGSGQYRATLYVVGVSAILFGIAFLWVVGRMHALW